MFKIAYKCFHNLVLCLLTLNCLHGIKLVTSVFIPVIVFLSKLGLNFVKSKAMFCYAAPDVWNLLILLSVSRLDIVTVSQFKINLESLL